MPRPPRLVLPGVPLHVIQRGNNRTQTFLSPEDLIQYRRMLGDASRRYRCHLHAYVFMPNHVHLLVTTEDGLGTARMMQAIGRRYVRYVNTRHRRTGTLWEGRYRSSLVDSERYFLTCSRYIELNPVRGNLARDPGDYRWSSYLCNAFGEPDPLITPHSTYENLDVLPSDRQAAYRALFDRVIPNETIDAIRRAVNTGGLLGDGSFKSRIEARVARSLARPPRGGDRRSSAFQVAARMSSATA
jgi:REP-associated tyrosine transposase